MARVAFVIGDYPSEERSRREKVALSYATAEVEVGIVSAPVTPYFHGMTAAEITMVSPALIQAFREAEAQGYDAAVPLGFLDLGVEGGRSAVDIPILAPFETALHVAALMGDRFGCIAYSEIHFPVLQALVRRYGMEHKIVGWAGSGFDLPDIAANHDAMVENFVAAARKLIDEDGADVIIPTGITQCPVHIDPKWLMKELGVPVSEGIGAPIRIAATFADLGLHHSRRRWPKSRSFDV